MACTIVPLAMTLVVALLLLAAVAAWQLRLIVRARFPGPGEQASPVANSRWPAFPPGVT